MKESSIQGINANQNVMGAASGNLAVQNADNTFGMEMRQTEMVASKKGFSGVRTTAVMDTSQGTIENTGKDLDVTIESGGAWLPVDYNGTIAFVPSFRGTIDKNGQLVAQVGDAQYKVLGWPTLSDGTLDPAKVQNKYKLTELTPIEADKVATIASATTKAGYTINLPANAALYDGSLTPAQNEAAGALQKTPTSIIDSQGNEHTVTLEWQKTAANQWTVTATCPDATNIKLNDTSGAAYSVIVVFGTDGLVDHYEDATSTTLTEPAKMFIEWGATSTQAADSTITMSFGEVKKPGGLTQYGDTYAANKPETDGVPYGNFNDVYIDREGFVIAKFTNGEEIKVGKLALAKFNNNELTRRGGVFLSNLKSGSPILAEAQKNGVGAIESGTIQKSNIDQAKELMNLVTAQLGVSINSEALRMQFEADKSLVRVAQSS